MHLKVCGKGRQTRLVTFVKLELQLSSTVARSDYIRRKLEND